MSNESAEQKVGTLLIRNTQVEHQYSFLDFVQSGCNISLILALDFTISNGHPENPTSLHHFDPQRPNDYMQAIECVGSILQYYDSDKKIPVYGFGAKLQPFQDKVSHCFALNGNIFAPEVEGINGVLEVYKNALGNIQFYGPTFFSQIIKMTSDYAQQDVSQLNSQQYYILLIITDGSINDIEATIDEIVRASSLPISIIIVGVGNEDFSLMRRLDSDDKALYSKNLDKTMERDIVQFVPFNDYKSDIKLLAQEVLEEVPVQLLSYFNQRKIKPNLVQKGKTQKVSIQRQNTQQQQSTYVINQFMEQMTSLGYNKESIKKLVKEGIPSLDVELIAQIMEHKKMPYISSKEEGSFRRPISKTTFDNVNSKTINQIEITTSPKNHQVHFQKLNSFNQLQQPRKSSIEEQPTKKHTVAAPNTQAHQEIAICKVCYSNQIDVVLLECGHRVVCSKCVSQCEKRCPNCRSPIARWVKTYNA